MSEKHNPSSKRIIRFTADSAIVLSFIVALEIVIMISPFAAFFYALFNPFLLALNQSSVTRWLTAFFLPHMIVPPNEVLVVIRVLGSIFFVGGMLVFLACAAQVYMGKLFRKGTATKGLYLFVRHPQYIGLALAALGLAIMWPRFLTLVLFAVMLLLYYLLARDEERRMTNRFAESYTAYQNRTGMFLPRPVERLFLRNPSSKERPGVVKVAGMFVILCVIIVGTGFILRSYTVHHLPIQEIHGVDVIAITSEDTTTGADLVPAVLEDSVVAAKLTSLTSEDHRVLAYFIPIDYVMQGMIANTGDEWKLFQQHKTIGMITDFVLHPFAHLTGGHEHHMANMQHGPEMYALPAMKRRVIFLEVRGNGQHLDSPFDDFDVNVQRIPLFFVDVHLHTAEILQVKDTPGGSGWGTVPTPMF
ncbi:MAG TPA: isoprenylcysteine carboxylmethyltransferase family protein [Bacteroidota bacterium]|nr:isoprenylcysteine carboxylmethyltransferase family protein [Bacteroidota bacterium]